MSTMMILRKVNEMILEYKGLCIGYEHKSIVNNINLQIEEGDYVCVFGDNGIGKTTFLKTTLGLIPPVRGTIKRTDKLNRNMVGYLPQQSKIPGEFPASAFEVVISGCVSRLRYFPFYRKAEKQMAKENMKLLGITNLANRPFRELSGGQQQRVLLARALCATDKLLILDEPFTGLDKNTTTSLYKILNKINKELGVTLIIVSHYKEEIVDYANKIVQLEKPEVFCGSKDEYKSKYLNLPVVKEGQNNE